MSVVGMDSDDEYQRELKLAVERYKKNQKLERKTNSKKLEVAKNQNQLAKEVKDNPLFLIDFVDKSGGKIKSCLREYENQGAIPKGIYAKIKSNEMSIHDYSNGKTRKRSSRRDSSHSSTARSVSSGRQFGRKSATSEKNSGLDKIVRNSNTSNTNDKAGEESQSFYYIVPEEPSPNFFLSPGTYYVVPKPVDFSIKTLLVCHPPRSKKDSLKNGFETDTDHRKSMEHFIVNPEKMNDVNKSEQNCSNVIWASDLISQYNSGCSKEEILTKMKTVKLGLEAEIEGFKSALTEATMALDQLSTLEFSLNYKVSRDKEFDDEGVNTEEDFKGTESHEENGAEVKTPAENHLVNEEGDGEGGSNVILVENSPKDVELTIGEEERTVEDPLVLDDNGIPVEEYSEEKLQEDLINNQILNIVSVLPDICENYLRTELQKIGGDANLINIFINEHIESENYPKAYVDSDASERKRLWKEYVTDFNPKKFLFELPTVSSKGAAASKSNDNDDIDLVMSFLMKRYPTQPLSKLRNDYEMSKNIVEVCKSCDMIVKPVRLSESGFEEEKFNKEFLLKMFCVMMDRLSDFHLQTGIEHHLTSRGRKFEKVVHLDHEQEIDNYLSEIQERRELEREEAKLHNAFLHCVTCYDEIVPSETTTCSEGHIFCSNCVETYIRVELGRGVYKFKCFSGSCDALFDHKTLEELLPTSDLMKISMKQQAEEIMKAKVDGLESCSFCDFAYVPDTDDKIFKCQNPMCMAEICRNCRERSHIPLRCNEIERPKDVEARKKIEEVMTNALLRSCPNCKKKIVKIDGCNKITCTCGIFFCYLCGNRINDYSHFGRVCRLFTNNTELHVQRIAEAGIQARDELLRTDHGVQIVHDPTKDFYRYTETVIPKKTY